MNILVDDFFWRSCQAVYAASHTQIRSMLRCLKAWHRSDMILVPVWLQSVFNFYLHQWSMIHNLKGNTHVDLHLSSPVYTDKPILSSYHLDKLKNWVCSQWMAWLFGSLHKSFSAWASSTIVEGISCFWKPRTMVVFKRGISYDCQRILMNIQTPEEVRRKKIKSSIMHHLELRQSHTCNISASHSLKSGLFDHVWPRHFFPGKNQHPCWFPLRVMVESWDISTGHLHRLLLCFSSSGAHRSIFFRGMPTKSLKSPQFSRVPVLCPRSRGQPGRQARQSASPTARVLLGGHDYPFISDLQHDWWEVMQKGGLLMNRNLANQLRVALYHV